MVMYMHSIQMELALRRRILIFYCRAGVVFTNAHSSASVCAPTRYALLTGNHVYRGRNPGGTWDHFSGSQILPDQQTIADVLKGLAIPLHSSGKAILVPRF